LGLIVFLCVALVSAVVWHSFLSKVWIASIAAGVSSSVLFQLIAAIQLGYWDPFFLVGFFFGFFPALIIALIVGLIFHRKRKD